MGIKNPHKPDFSSIAVNHPDIITKEQKAAERERVSKTLAKEHWLHQIMALDQRAQKAKEILRDLAAHEAKAETSQEAEFYREKMKKYRAELFTCEMSVKELKKNVG